MLKGDLADLSLTELISALGGVGQSGKLQVLLHQDQEEAPFLTGEIYFKQGQPIHAVVRWEGKAWEGEPVLLVLAGLKGGVFQFQPGLAPPKATLLGGLTIPMRVAEAQEVFRRLAHLPADWTHVLHLSETTDEVELSLEEVKLLGEAEGKRIVELLLSSDDPLRVAQGLDRLLAQGVLEAVPGIEIPPHELLVLPIYGPGEGVAFLDEGLYARWAGLLGGRFWLRAFRVGGVDLGRFEAKPRPSLEGRIGLMEKDLARLRLRRGEKVQVVPEVKRGHPGGQ